MNRRLSSTAKILVGVAILTATLCVATFPASAQETASEQVRQGGTLTVAIEAEVRETDAFQARINLDKMVMGSTVYDPLFQAAEDGSFLPALATEANPSADAKEWTIKLREGVKFHNGKLLTAADVKRSIDAYLDPARASNLAGDLANIASVTVANDHEVRIQLKNPDGQLPSIFVDGIFIVDIDDYDPNHPIGTGPYQWEERVIGDRMSFTRFPDHWRGVPPLDRVVFRVVPDAQVAALELQAGGVDMVVPNYIATDALPTLRRDPNIRIYEASGNTVYQAFLNFEKERRGGYKDAAAFREGMAYLWNAQTLVPPIIGEFGILATQVIPPWQIGHDPSIQPWPYDPVRGKELLAKAGVDEGDEIYMLVWNRPYNCNHATAFASQLTELGYKPRVACIQPEAAVPAVQAYDWDLLFALTSGRPTSYRQYFDRWRMSLAKVPDDFYTMRDEELEQVIAAMGTTVDPVEYERLGQRAAQIIVKERIGMLPAYWDTVRMAARSRVKGIKVSPLVYYGFLMSQMTTVWIDQD